MPHRLSALFALAASVLATPAMAQEVYLGGSAHGVDLPTSLETDESGFDVQFGARTGPIEGLSAIGRPYAYAHGQVSTNGGTSFGAVGLGWKLGKGPFYVSPAIGVAVHDGTIPRFNAAGTRIDLGSRVIFNPNLALGYRLNQRAAVELSWEHISHATLLSGQNPGMDFLGARLVWRLR